MKSVWYVGLLAAAAVIAGPAPARIADTTSSAPTNPQADIWQQISDADQKNDYDTVLALLGPLLKNARATLSAEEIEGGYFAAARSAYHLNRWDEARTYGVTGTELAPKSGRLWRFRLLLDLRDKRLEDAVVTVEAMAKADADAFNDISQGSFTSLSESLRSQHQTALERRLLKLMVGDNFVSTAPFPQKDYFRSVYASMLYADGDKVGATALIRQITDPAELEGLSFDPRFAASLPADFDLRAAVERSLAEAQEVMRVHPDLLEPIVRVSLRLRQLGRPQESLALLESARARVLRDGGFADAGEQVSWWWNSLSKTYRMLGRFDDAAAAMLAASNEKERGQLNVSQAINLAFLQLRFGKAQEALKTLAPFDKSNLNMSPFGAMAMRGVRACATARSNGVAAAATDIAYLKAHETENPNALFGLMLCIGDVDGTAAALIQQLGDPDRMGSTLAQLSEFDDPPVALPPDPVYATYEKVKQRADVKAAIARAGRTQRIHLQREEL